MREVSPIGLCLASETSPVTTSIRRHPFGTTPDGQTVERFVLGEPGGVEASIMTYGAALQALVAPDRDAHLANICLGFGTLAGYVENTGHYFGATVGRYANRIAGARFALDGIVHEVDRNDGQNCLHGGAGGFDTRIWHVVEAAGGMLRLAYTSPDGAKVVDFAIVVPNPGIPGQHGSQVNPKFHGDKNSLYQIQDTTQPVSERFLMWNEAGTWAEPNGLPGVPYLLDTTGMTEAEFWATANALVK
jgi:hypothetical protein